MRLTVLIILFPGILSAQDPLDIIQHYFDTVSSGDVARWNDIKSVYIESMAAYSQANFEGKATDFSEQKLNLQKLYRVWPDKSRMDSFVDSTLSSSTYHNRDGNFFVFGNMPPVPISSGPYEPYFEFEPIIVKHAIDKRKGIKLVGIKEMGESKCYDIELVTRDLTWHFYFNTQTFLLEYWSNSRGGEPASLTRVFDYERFGDYLIPMSETKRTERGEFFWCKRQRIDLNVAIDPSVFVYKSK